jgi:hypothetical protein
MAATKVPTTEKWTVTAYESLEEYVEAAQKYPNDIDKMFWTMCSDPYDDEPVSDFLEGILAKTAIPRHILDKILYDCVVTRAADYVDELLKIGADMYSPLFKTSIMDVLITSHFGYNTVCLEETVEVYQVLAKRSWFKPKISASTLNKIMSDKKMKMYICDNSEYMTMIKECEVIA